MRYHSHSDHFHGVCYLVLVSEEEEKHNLLHPCCPTLRVCGNHNILLTEAKVLPKPIELGVRGAMRRNKKGRWRESERVCVRESVCVRERVKEREGGRYSAGVVEGRVIDVVIEHVAIPKLSRMGELDCITHIHTSNLALALTRV